MKTLPIYSCIWHWFDKKYEEYYLSLITTHFDPFIDSVTFDTEYIDSETPPLFPSSNYSELILPHISKGDSVVGGPKTRDLSTIFALSLDFSSTEESLTSAFVHQAFTHTHTIVLELMVRQQLPCRDLNYALQEVYPPRLSLPRSWPCTRIPPIIHLHQNPAVHVAWMAIHAHRIPRICTDAIPVKEACEDVERPMQPLQLGQGNKSIARIKILQKVSHQHARPIRALLSFHNHCHPVVDDGVHDHVKERGGKGSPWVTTWYPLKARPNYLMALDTIVFRS